MFFLLREVLCLRITLLNWFRDQGFVKPGNSGKGKNPKTNRDRDRDSGDAPRTKFHLLSHLILQYTDIIITITMVLPGRSLDPGSHDSTWTRAWSVF